MTEDVAEAVAKIIHRHLGRATPFGADPMEAASCRHAAQAALSAARPFIRNEAFEEAARKLDKLQDGQALRLLGGEMTSQEVRTVKAVLANRTTAIRSLKDSE